MIDITSLVLLAVSFFFVAVSFALLVKYREVSERINSSTDLGRDLWSSLENRLKKQDERILDMMGRFEVVQSRVMATSAASPANEPSISSPLQPTSPPATSELEEHHVSEVPAQRLESHAMVASQAPSEPLTRTSELDETQLAAMRLLVDASKNTRQLTDALGKSREHTARVLKSLFEAGLLRRNDSAKPFVYELTLEGRRLLGTNAGPGPGAGTPDVPS